MAKAKTTAQLTVIVADLQTQIQAQGETIKLQASQIKEMRAIIDDIPNTVFNETKADSSDVHKKVK